MQLVQTLPRSARTAHHTRVVEQLDHAKVVGRHEQLPAARAVDSVDVGAVGLGRPHAHDVEAEHRREGVEVDVALRERDLLAGARVPEQLLVVCRVGAHNGRVAAPVNAAHRAAVPSAARHSLVAALDAASACRR
eukprot:115462-Chlamydomonas_euryale.AAC.1